MRKPGPTHVTLRKDCTKGRSLKYSTVNLQVYFVKQIIYECMSPQVAGEAD